MQRTCRGDDDTLVTPDGRACDCGTTFDDATRSVIWPHQELMTDADKKAVTDALIQKLLGLGEGRFW